MRIHRQMRASLKAGHHQPLLVLDVARVSRFSDEHQKIFSLLEGVLSIAGGNEIHLVPIAALQRKSDPGESAIKGQECRNRALATLGCDNPLAVALNGSEPSSLRCFGTNP
jgi:hypothetical protein